MNYVINKTIESINVVNLRKIAINEYLVYLRANILRNDNDKIK